LWLVGCLRGEKEKCAKHGTVTTTRSPLGRQRHYNSRSIWVNRLLSIRRAPDVLKLYRHLICRSRDPPISPNRARPFSHEKRASLKRAGDQQSCGPSFTSEPWKSCTLRLWCVSLPPVHPEIGPFIRRSKDRQLSSLPFGAVFPFAPFAYWPWPPRGPHSRKVSLPQYLAIAVAAIAPGTYCDTPKLNV
jgi:hypothetical protein